MTRRTRSPEWIEQLATDWHAADLTDREAALLGYAEKLTLTPAGMVEEDVAALRAAGLSDAAILEANLVVAYFAYANRIADGLGVSLEEGDDAS